jgi:hypothetical protein
MRAFARRHDRKCATTLRALGQVTMKRDTAPHVSQIVRGLNDLAAMIRFITQSRDFATLPVSHSNSLYSPPAMARSSIYRFRSSEAVRNDHK